MKTAVVTGANGFVGSKLVKSLASDGWNVRAVLRTSMPKEIPNVEQFAVGDIASFNEWDKVMEGADAVVHLAALVHADEKDDYQYEDYLKVNTEATRNMAVAAVSVGVKRFIFMSTVKVCGEKSPGDQPFTEKSSPLPEDSYAKSKLEAEKSLRTIEKESGLNVVIIRPPLVYGAGVKANMGKLLEAIRKWPILAVPSVNNRRSFIYLENLIDAVKTCLEKPEAAGETFFVSDKHDVSTFELVTLIAGFTKHGAVIFKLPKGLLIWTGRLFDFIQKLLGRSLPVNSDAISKLFYSLAVDSSLIKEKLGWEPPHTLEEGLKTVATCNLNDKDDYNGYWLRTYDYLAVFIAWFLASLIRHDFILTDVGLTWFLMTTSTVLISQYIVFQLVGLGWGVRSSKRFCSFPDIVRISLIGMIIIGIGLFLINRLEGVPRITIALYPVILSCLLAFPRIWINDRGSKQSGEIKEHGDELTGIASLMTGNETALSALQATSDSSATAVASVIIVNYNAGELLTESVRSVLASDVPVEVIVSDNGSNDGSIGYLQKRAGDDKRLKIVENRANLGFAKANNKVLPYASGKYLLLLNPDCIIEPDTIKNMVQLMDERENVGMSGCLIKNLDGTEQAGCRRRVPTPWRSFVRVMGLSRIFPNRYRFQEFSLHTQPLPDQPVSVEALSGAFMFVRREALEQVGLLDDKYFMHCEDLDWCMRFRHLKWDIVFNPFVEVTHIKGRSSRDRLFFVLWHKHKGMVRFYNKFFRHQYPMPLMWLVVISVWARFVLISMIMVFQRSFARIEDKDLY